MWQYKHFEDLSAREYHDILKERTKIFVVEQNSAYQEVDDIDLDATHLIKRDKGCIKAYARVYKKDQRPRIGRVLVPEEFRGEGHGRELFEKAISFIKAKYPSKTIEIQAEAYLKEFYASFGFEPISEEYLDCDIPHIDMELKSEIALQKEA
jgi:ElaA protein